MPGREKKAEHTRDSNGQDILLKNARYQMMMAWEKPYMEACIKALQPSGDVLEIGFGLGYSAEAIQQYPIRSHTIVECDPEIAQTARRWARNKTRVHIIEDIWQRALPKLGQFDAIFFDDYPLDGDEYLENTLPQAGEAPSMTERDIDAFFAAIDRGEMSIAFDNSLYRFFVEERNKGTLSHALFSYAKNQALKKGLWSEEERTIEYTPKREDDRLYHFLDECLTNHMRAGARFSCYFEEPTSRFLDDHFRETYLLDPAIKYEEQTIPVTPPEHCSYYTSDTALVATMQLCQRR